MKALSFPPQPRRPEEPPREVVNRILSGAGGWLQSVWNIYPPYLHETGTYLGVSGQNIPQIVERADLVLSDLHDFGPRAENPRVGGSIPPLATSAEFSVIQSAGSHNGERPFDDATPNVARCSRAK